MIDEVNAALPVAPAQGVHFEYIGNDVISVFLDGIGEHGGETSGSEGSDLGMGIGLSSGTNLLAGAGYVGGDDRGTQDDKGFGEDCYGTGGSWTAGALRGEGGVLPEGSAGARQSAAQTVADGEAQTFVTASPSAEVVVNQVPFPELSPRIVNYTSRSDHMEEYYANNGDIGEEGIADNRHGGVGAQGHYIETHGEHDNQNGESHRLDIRNGDAGGAGGAEADCIERDGENDVEEYFIASGGELSSEDGETSEASSAEQCFVGSGADGEQGETCRALSCEMQGRELEGTGGPQGLVGHGMYGLFGLSVAGGMDGASGMGGIDGELEGRRSAYALRRGFCSSTSTYRRSSMCTISERPAGGAFLF